MSPDFNAPSFAANYASSGPHNPHWRAHPFGLEQKLGELSSQFSGHSANLIGMQDSMQIPQNNPTVAAQAALAKLGGEFVEHKAENAPVHPRHNRPAPSAHNSPSFPKPGMH